MKFSLSCVAALFAATALATPVSNDLLEKRDIRGHYTVSGLGARKQAILNAGGNTLDIAIAMLEIEDMNTSHYPYGDAKTKDSANFGLFKQNWGQLRVCASRYGFVGQPESNWNNGAILNSNVKADIASRWDCQRYYGYDKWFAGHRYGASGLEDPYTQDILNYKSSVEWIKQQIDSHPAYKTDDTRFYVEVVAI